MQYSELIERKAQCGADSGFEPLSLPDSLFGFQAFLTDWAIRRGRAGIFSDCGTGKTRMELVWADNMARKTGKPTLILTPLAVSSQTVREAEDCGIGAYRSMDGTLKGDIVVTNYEKLAKFSSGDFGAVVCDESSCLKNFNGVRRGEITEFMRRMPYRLLATATAAPNDYTELGTSSEALGYLGHMDMLARFFKNDNNNSASRRMYGEAPKFRFKGHAEQPFWRWVTSWSRACRKPSDIGFEDGGFTLPPMTETEYLVDPKTLPDGKLFQMPARTLPEQREERKRTIKERCEKVAELVDTGRPALVWCHMNAEGDLLEKLILGAVQVSGSDSDDAKERKFLAFISGEARVLICKPKIGAWGLNFQHCDHVVYFPSHSYEAYYQAVRRCWRFGQKNPVQVDLVLTEGEHRVMANLRHKAKAADQMFSNLVGEMNNSIALERRVNNFTEKMEIPSWL